MEYGFRRRLQTIQSRKGKKKEADGKRISSPRPCS